MNRERAEDWLTGFVMGVGSAIVLPAHQAKRLFLIAATALVVTKAQAVYAKG